MKQTLKEHRLLVLLVVVSIGGTVVAMAADQFGYFDHTAANPEPELVEEEIIDEPWMSDPDARKAAQDVMRRKALVSELNGLEADSEALTAQYEADLAIINQRIEEIQKELGTY